MMWKTESNENQWNKKLALCKWSIQLIAPRVLRNSVLYTPLHHLLSLFQGPLPSAAWQTSQHLNAWVSYATESLGHPLPWTECAAPAGCGNTSREGGYAKCDQSRANSCGEQNDGGRLGCLVSGSTFSRCGADAGLVALWAVGLVDSVRLCVPFREALSTRASVGHTLGEA